MSRAALLLACPHCSVATISEADKLECGMFGPPCKCSACGGYSRELKWPRLWRSLLLYVAPWVLLVPLAALYEAAPRARNQDAAVAGLLLLGGALLVWEFWLAGVAEAHFARRIPLRPVHPTRLWRYWDVFKEICRWTFLAGIVLTFVFAWYVHRQ